MSLEEEGEASTRTGYFDLPLWSEGKMIFARCQGCGTDLVPGLGGWEWGGFFQDIDSNILQM